jgi:predicted RNA-binding Zn ribbon-like protein
MTSQAWTPVDEHKPAPPGLQPIQALVNTRDLEEGTDLLEDEDGARTWLREVGLIGGREQPSKADLRLLVGVREGLRAMLAHNSGDPAPTAEQLEPIRRLLERERPGLELDQQGGLRLQAAGKTLQGGLLELLLRVRDSQLDSSWAQLKLCANPDCRWAFYDRSRNHQGTWCRMEVCGNRLKNRRLRARRR